MKSTLALLGLALVVVISPPQPDVLHSRNPNQVQQRSAGKGPKDIPTITEEAARATVLVIASSSDGQQLNQGSGFVVSNDGRIVTNYHVVEGAKSAIVKFPNGAFYVVEGIVGIDRQADIAIIRAVGKDFPTLTLGDSDTVRVGQEVVAIGSPLSLEATVSNGIISAIRELEDKKMKVFQTTAPISPGSSGGALLDREGHAVAITSFQYARGQNLNFAIPINYAKFLLTGNAVRPFSAFDDSIESSRRTAKESQPGATTVRGSLWKMAGGPPDFLVRLTIEGDLAFAEQVFEYHDRPGYELEKNQCNLRRSGETYVGTCTVVWWVRDSTGLRQCSHKTSMEVLGVASTLITVREKDAPDFTTRQVTLNDFKNCFVGIPRKSEEYRWVPSADLPIPERKKWKAAGVAHEYETVMRDGELTLRWRANFGEPWGQSKFHREGNDYVGSIAVDLGCDLCDSVFAPARLQFSGTNVLRLVYHRPDKGDCKACTVRKWQPKPVELVFVRD